MKFLVWLEITLITKLILEYATRVSLLVTKLPCQGKLNKEQIYVCLVRYLYYKI